MTNQIPGALALGYVVAKLTDSFQLPLIVPVLIVLSVYVVAYVVSRLEGK